ncbi:protoheme IX farnesyltransferase [Pelagibius litoralis]|uniref:Protoheme IX farnesyltransferase n=1 Tax=Pelagibius litoralis TaxID=374515 RepID=A0A967KGI9_9PROT|nr:heme o synthase [Pelagibius litoralis]NIA72195.1 protoheme IX farnesyltransferase [Pelagibius litoralis]
MSDASLSLAGAEVSFTEAPAAARRSGARVSDYFALLKPRVMSLVVFSGFAGLYAAPGDIHPFLAAVAVLCIAVGAGAAGAINMWYERDIDAVMERTRGRPLPRGRIAPQEALAFGVILSLLSVMLMGIAINWAAAALLGLANAFYVFVYTIWLKRRTPQNIVIGGAAGAFPPMIGWAAVTGGVELQSIALFALIFIWTPPHFWALALYRRIDYTKARVPMLPVVAGAAATKRQILLYSLVLAPLGLVPAFLGTAGVVYGLVAAVMGLCFVLLALRVQREEGDKAAKQLFGFSILYLFVLFGLIIVDRAPGLLTEAAPVLAAVSWIVG